MKELEFHPYANLFPLIEGQAFEELRASVRKHGLREPIVLHQGQILDGRNRYRACRMEGAKLRFVVFGFPLPDTPDWVVELAKQSKPLNEREMGLLPSAAAHLTYDFTMGGVVGADALAFVIDKNLHRRHLDETQRAMVASRLANLGHGGKRAYKAPAEQAANLPVGPAPAAPAPVTQAAAAKLLNVSERTVRSAKAVVEHGVPELVAKADAGELAVSVASDLARLPAELQREVLRSADVGALYRVIKEQNEALTAQKKAKRAEKVKALGAKQKALPAKKYGVIYADPEWDQETWSDAGKNRGAANHYPVSSTAVIKSRPVQDIAAPDCVLFMWVTVPHLAQGIEVLRAWGFAYKSSCIWEKIYPGKQQGMGYWFRVNHEVLLVATRGNIPAPAMGTQWPSVIEAPVGKHSEKPEKFAELIEAYFGDLPKIELNARKARPGWDVWGLEAPKEPGLPLAGADDWPAPDVCEPNEPALLRPGVLVKPSYGSGPFVILSAAERGGFWSLTCDLASSASLRGNSFFNELTIANGVVSDPHGGTVEIVGFDEVAADVLAERASRGDGGRYRVYDDYGRTTERGLQALKQAVESGAVIWHTVGDSEASTIIRLSNGDFESPGRGTHYKAYEDGEAVDGLHLSRRDGIVEVHSYWDGSCGFSGSTMPYAKVNAFLGKLAKWRPPVPAQISTPADDVDDADIPAFLKRDPDTADMFEGEGA